MTAAELVLPPNSTKRRSSSELLDDGRSSRCDSIGHEKPDSGVDLDEDFAKPSDEQIRQIVQVVENYFSDESLQKDSFLLKHVRKGEKGVSLKLVASLRKVKSITNGKNSKAVAYAIRSSSTSLVLNDAETKVRRVTPLDDSLLLPQPIDRPQTRWLLLYRLEANASPATVSAQLSPFGEIATVQLFGTSAALPAELMPVVRQHPEMSDGPVALVEFQSAQSAESAVRQLEQASQRSWRSNSMRALLFDKQKQQQFVMMNQNSSKNELQMSESSKRLSFYPHKRQIDQVKRQAVGLLCRQKSKSESNASSSSSPDSSSSTASEKQRPSALAQLSIRASSGNINLLRHPRGPDGTTGFHSRCGTKLRSNSAPMPRQLI